MHGDKWPLIVSSISILASHFTLEVFSYKSLYGQSFAVIYSCMVVAWKPCVYNYLPFNGSQVHNIACIVLTQENYKNLENPVNYVCIRGARYNACD